MVVNIYDLIRLNFINMIRRKDISSLSEIKNDCSELASLLLAMTAGVDLLQKPAHRELLEESLKEIITSLIDSMQNAREAVGYKVNFENENVLKVRIESFFTQDDYKLELHEKSYSFEKSSIRSRLGNGTKQVSGDSNSIIMIEQNHTGTGEEHICGYKKTVDDFGFVTEETHVAKPGNQIALKRNKEGIVVNETTSVDWSGDPFQLNQQNVSEKEKRKKVINTISKYPHTKEYYEELLGIDFGDLENLIKH